MKAFETCSMLSKEFCFDNSRLYCTWDPYVLPSAETMQKSLASCSPCDIEALNKTASPASLCIPQSVPEFASGEPAHESKVFERRLTACEVWSYGVPYVAMSNQAPDAQCLHRFGSDLSGYSNFWCISSGAYLAVCRPGSRTAAEKRPAMPIGSLRCGDFGRTWWLPRFAPARCNTNQHEPTLPKPLSPWRSSSHGLNGRSVHFRVQISHTVCHPGMGWMWVGRLFPSLYSCQNQPTELPNQVYLYPTKPQSNLVLSLTPTSSSLSIM